MYLNRIQLINNGPIQRLDVSLPFNGDKPRPIVLVGENGTGKSILLSHIVNALVAAQCVAFPEAPEVDEGKVYMLRSPSYIRAESECYFGRVDFTEDLYMSELQTRRQRTTYSTIPEDLSSEDSQRAWNAMPGAVTSHLMTSIESGLRDKLEKIFAANCVLYFPSNRFEEPAWLNEMNLKAKAKYMDLRHVRGYTERTVINHSPLTNVQDWLFGVAYDRSAFELQTSTFSNLPIFLGYRGRATKAYEAALKIVRTILRLGDTGRLGIGPRVNRVIEVIENQQTIVPNLFQLSGGEVNLLDIFLSILRDVDLAGTSYQTPEDVTGIVVIDELDVHLHAVHQYEILPKLIEMFPRVQFVVTSHSPLLVLGLQNSLGKEGLALYRMPEGNQIDAEEFEEFGNAYNVFKGTATYDADVRLAIQSAQKPVVFVDGGTDILYLQRAAELLNFDDKLSKVELRDGGGDGNLKRVWKALDTSGQFGLVRHKVVILHDCDSDVEDGEKGTVFRRKISLLQEGPIKRGVENLFGKATIEKAKDFNLAFIDIDQGE